MKDKTMEQIYEEHLEKEPKKFAKFFPEIKQGIETLEHTKWKIEKKNLELVKSISPTKRIEALNLLKRGHTCGDVASKLGIKDHMAVFYLIHYNIQDISILRDESI